MNDFQQSLPSKQRHLEKNLLLCGQGVVWPMTALIFALGHIKSFCSRQGTPNDSTQTPTHLYLFKNLFIRRVWERRSCLIQTQTWESIVSFSDFRQIILMRQTVQTWPLSVAISMNRQNKHPPGKPAFILSRRSDNDRQTNPRNLRKQNHLDRQQALQHPISLSYRPPVSYPLTSGHYIPPTFRHPSGDGREFHCLLFIKRWPLLLALKRAPYNQGQTEYSLWTMCRNLVCLFKLWPMCRPRLGRRG